VARKKSKPKAHKHRAPRRKPGKKAAVKRPISLYYPKPDEMRGKVRVEPPKIPIPSAPIDIKPVPSLARIEEPRKKPHHDALVSVGASLVLSACIAVFFYYAINLDAVYSLVLALPFFIGLSILFYNFLELSERTGAK
jgi:hypothetical protein